MRKGYCHLVNDPDSLPDVAAVNEFKAQFDIPIPRARVAVLPFDKIDVDPDNTYTGMTFSDTPLPEIVSVLNKVYQARITLASPSMDRCTMTATFDRQTLPQVLRIMEETLEIKTVTGPDGIQLSSVTRCE